MRGHGRAHAEGCRCQGDPNRGRAKTKTWVSGVRRLEVEAGQSNASDYWNFGNKARSPRTQLASGQVEQ